VTQRSRQQEAAARRKAASRHEAETDRTGAAYEAAKAAHDAAARAVGLPTDGTVGKAQYDAAAKAARENDAPALVWWAARNALEQAYNDDADAWERRRASEARADRAERAAAAEAHREAKAK
jgi:hypothetical protein